MLSIRTCGFLLVIGMLVIGCQPAAEKGGSEEKKSAAVENSGTETKAVAVTIYCGKCGEIKGSEKCCKEADVCSHCGKHDGSPLCCKDLGEGSQGKDVCATCGQFAGANHKCDATAEKCSKCGLDKGSPGCCKL